MDEGKFVADFIASNIEKIIDLGKSAYGKADETIRLKLKIAYSDYLNNTRDKYSKSKSFFIRNNSVDIYSYYVPTGISCGNDVIKIPKFKSCHNYSNRLVITGTGGSGKSVLMRHLFLDCVSQKEYVPILIELRDLNVAKVSLDDFILETLDLYGFDISGDFVEKAKVEGHFCFFMDGYDEVDHSIRKGLIKQINKLSNKYKKCPIFISSRPDEVFNGIEDFSVFNVLPLDLESASALINKLPFDKEIKNKFVSDLKDGLFTKHKSFLSNPLLLSIMLLTYGENAEIPSKLSIFYNQAYEALFQRHDANKGGYSRIRKTSLDIQDFARVFSVFALQTYEKRIFKMPRTKCLDFIENSIKSLKKDLEPDDYLHDLLSAACLMIEDGLEIAFSHRSFQEYFVAIYINSAPPEIQDRLINRYWTNMISDNVIYLLTEINPDLVERVLLVPKLEILFDDIGVKNQVGITHATKYIKRVYTYINIDKEKMSATMNGTDANESTLVHLAVYLCNTFEFPGEDYINRRQEYMVDNYGDESKRVRYETDVITYKTPVMVDILQGKGVFSLRYLQAAYEAYKSLKLKHENSSHSLEELLGI